MAQGLPPGPLSAYLGVRQQNAAEDMAGMGLLQRMQEAQEARKLRQALAQQGDIRQRELATMTDARSRELAQMLDARSREATEMMNTRMRELAADREATRRDLAAESGGLRRDLAAQADVTRRELALNSEALRRELAAGKITDKAEQKAATGDYAELLTDRLNTLLTENPRSATGIFAPVVRATEAVVNSLAPGAIGSQATITSQTKEQLITVLSQLRGGSQGRLSNQDMRRIDTAIGQINSGTSEGMAQGLSDTYDLIDTLQSKPARSGKGISRPIGRASVPPPPPGFRVDE